MSDENQNLEHEEQSEGVRNLRAKLKEEADARHLAEERIAQFEAKERETSLKQTFIEVGLPVASIGLYPQDGDVTGAAVATWASNYGIAPAPRAPEPQMTREQEILERHNQVIGQAFARPSDLSTMEDLAREMYKKAADSYESDFKPTMQEEADIKKDIQTVNKLNAQGEIDVRMGRMTKHTEGFGGLTSPPYYADKVAQTTAR